MKRKRLELTPEDRAILLVNGLGLGGSIPDAIYYRKHCKWADQRDADFMLLLAETRGVWMSLPDWIAMLEKRGLKGYGEWTPAVRAIAHKG